MMNKVVIDALAPTGVLRVGLNLSNSLLVSSKANDGSVYGVSPDIGQRIAEELGVPCELVSFKSPGEIADSVDQDLWDIGNIAVEPERAMSIDFSVPYALIEANFMVCRDSPFVFNKDIDKAGVRIATFGRSAYDLWLDKNFTKATMVRYGSIDQSHEGFKNGKTTVLASLKPKLIEEVLANDTGRIIEPPFTAIKQAIGIKKGNIVALSFLNYFLISLLKTGFIAASIEKHEVVNKLGIPDM